MERFRHISRRRRRIDGVVGGLATAAPEREERHASRWCPDARDATPREHRSARTQKQRTHAASVQLGAPRKCQRDDDTVIKCARSTWPNPALQNPRSRPPSMRLLELVEAIQEQAKDGRSSGRVWFARRIKLRRRSPAAGSSALAAMPGRSQGRFATSKTCVFSDSRMHVPARHFPPASGAARAPGSQAWSGSRTADECVPSTFYHGVGLRGQSASRAHRATPSSRVASMAWRQLRKF